MSARISAALLAILALCAQPLAVSAQCLNNVAAYNPNLRTQTTNGSEQHPFSPASFTEH